MTIFPTSLYQETYNNFKSIEKEKILNEFEKTEFHRKISKHDVDTRLGL
jgi:hypothetical protein